MFLMVLKSSLKSVNKVEFMTVNKCQEQWMLTFYKVKYTNVHMTYKYNQVCWCSWPLKIVET